MGTATLLECFACTRRMRRLPRPLHFMRPFQPIRCYPETAAPQWECTYGDEQGRWCSFVHEGIILLYSVFQVDRYLFTGIRLEPLSCVHPCCSETMTFLPSWILPLIVMWPCDERRPPCLTHCCFLFSFSSPSHQRSLEIGAHSEGLSHGLRQRICNEQRARVELVRRQRGRRGCQQVTCCLTWGHISSWSSRSSGVCSFHAPASCWVTTAWRF